jgi:hypothetical protein
MIASEILAALHLLVSARQPAFVWGEPGVGKSDVMRQLAISRSVPLLDVRALLLDPVDLRGLPYLEADCDPAQNQPSRKLAKWAIPDFLPKDGEGILFLDELTSAVPMVQAAFYQLVLDRKLGDYRLPDGWAIVAAGNRQGDRGVTHQMPTPLRNRFCHLTFEVNLQEWCEWAIRNAIRPEVIAFLRFKPELLSKFDRDETAFPSPRSWSFASKVLAQAPRGQVENGLIAGCVGDGAATEFTSFLATFRSLPNIDAIIMNPDKEPVPNEAGALHAVASALSYAAAVSNFDRIHTYLRRMPEEFQVFSVQAATLRTPDLRHTAAFTQFAVEHHKLIA